MFKTDRHETPPSLTNKLAEEIAASECLGIKHCTVLTNVPATGNPVFSLPEPKGS